MAVDGFDDSTEFAPHLQKETLELTVLQKEVLKTIYSVALSLKVRISRRNLISQSAHPGVDILSE